MSGLRSAAFWMGATVIAAALPVGAFISVAPNIHGRITREAAETFGFSSKAIAEVVDANYHQDRDEVHFDRRKGYAWFSPRGAHYTAAHHFDRNVLSSPSHEEDQAAFKAGVAYLMEQRALAIQKVTSAGGDRTKVRDGLRALGKACHALQDSFSHSNYVDLQPDPQSEFRKALEDASKPPPTGLRMTGYSKETGLAIPDDDYSHDDHCKDGLLLAIKPMGESREMIGGERKFDLASRAAVAATIELFKYVKSQCGSAWSGVSGY